ncbi:MAG: hypothetical protein IRZ23_08155 [Acetobacteraceae bacterium]|nr:hypothetical protein [Acetobacteraceae bacterium]
MLRLPFGRMLTDFQPLKEAEEKILHAVAAGTPAIIGQSRPEPESQACAVRAEFLRFLALGGDADAPVHEKGIIVQGAWITGTLDLSDTEIGRALIFRNCRFAAAPRLYDANVRGFLSWEGCALPGLKADRLQCRSGLYLRGGFEAEGEVRLRGAKIGGNLDCSESKFENANGFAVNAEGMFVSGVFIFRDVTITRGSINLGFAQVARLLDDLTSWPQGIVLNGFVYNGFIGQASTRAEERLQWLDKQSPEHSGKAKNPREFRPQPWQQLRKVLHDDGHYEDARRVAIEFENRKRFCGVIGETPPRPKFQGQTKSLRQIIAFTAQWFVFGAKWIPSCIVRFFHWIYGLAFGYGYRPLRLLGIVVAFWFLSTGVFCLAAQNNLFVPSDPAHIGLLEKPAFDACNPDKTPSGNWTSCTSLPPNYPGFHSLVYALDVMLPITKLGQEDHWTLIDPRKAKTTFARDLAWFTRIWAWIGTLFSWGVGAMILATFTNLLKRQDE